MEYSFFLLFSSLLMVTIESTLRFLFHYITWLWVEKIFTLELFSQCDHLIAIQKCNICVLHKKNSRLFAESIKSKKFYTLSFFSLLFILLLLFTIFRFTSRPFFVFHAFYSFRSWFFTTSSLKSFELFVFQCCNVLFSLNFLCHCVLCHLFSVFYNFYAKRLAKVHFFLLQTQILKKVYERMDEKKRKQKNEKDDNWSLYSLLYAMCCLKYFNSIVSIWL